jgi:hypothetical protein
MLSDIIDSYKYDIEMFYKNCQQIEMKMKEDDTTTILNMNTLKDVPINILLNHLYIFEDDFKALYMMEPEHDLYDVLYDVLDEYLHDTKMDCWKYAEYLEMLHDWFTDEFDELMKSMEIKNMASDLAFVLCLIKWMKNNDIDFRSVGTLNKMKHYICLKSQKEIENKIAKIDEKNTECAIQGTDEWLKEREQYITASIAWKALDTLPNQNSLINEKCSVTKSFNGRYISLDGMTALQKGHCYEPISVMLYEHIFNTKISDYGCLRHDKYPFLAASPDGLNTEPSSSKYGRLLEIKNVTSRSLTGLPKKEYWIQMQLQMEVCDLDECDFFECDFKEFETKEAFETSNEKWKGCYVIILIDDKYVYKYCPIEENIKEWIDEINEPILKVCYWWLNVFSCVLVPRNKKWFELNIGRFEEMWNKIIDAKTTGILPAKKKIVVKKLDECLIME